MARFGMKRQNNTKLFSKLKKKILHVVPGPSTMNRCSTLSKPGGGGRCGTLWLGANWLRTLARARANYKYCSLHLEMLGHCGAVCASLQLHWDEPEQPAADTRQGFLRLPVHGGQDLGEGPEEQQPQAQELKREAVVVRIVPDMVASSIQESLHPPKQAPGQVEKASCQPERPAQGLPKEGGGDTWRAAFWRADGCHCARAFRGRVPSRGFLLLPRPFLLRKTATQEHLV